MNIKQKGKVAVAGLALIAATSCATIETAPIDDHTAIITQEDKERYRAEKKEDRIEWRDSIRTFHNGTYLGVRGGLEMSFLRFEYENKNPLHEIPNNYKTHGMLRVGGEIIFRNIIVQTKFPLNPLQKAEIGTNRYDVTENYLPNEPTLYRKIPLLETALIDYKEGPQLGIGRRNPLEKKDEYLEILLAGYPYTERVQYVREYDGIIQYFQQTNDVFNRSEVPTTRLYEIEEIENKGYKLSLQIGYGTKNFSVRLGIGGVIGQQELMKKSFLELGVTFGGDIL